MTSGRRERIAPHIDVVRPGNAGLAPTTVSRLVTDAGRPDALGSRRRKACAREGNRAREACVSP